MYTSDSHYITVCGLNVYTFIQPHKASIRAAYSYSPDRAVTLMIKHAENWHALTYCVMVVCSADMIWQSSSGLVVSLLCVYIQSGVVSFLHH